MANGEEAARLVVEELAPMEIRTLCAARYCESSVMNKGQLMCVRHWKMIPRELQKDIYKWYRKGAEQGCHPMTEYTVFVNRAIKLVFELEKLRGLR